ncbi:hypothetical protein ACIRL3_26000 [Streptomyces sp. NPDC102384]|uniref:hypothetical protein n=1 Tax=Streptomyces sp. NPDC102384 TaxID=3366166 RepID=UPI0037FD3364
MKPRTQIRVFVASVSLILASGIGNLLTDREIPVWRLAVSIIGMDCGAAAIVLALREYRRGWPK